MVDVTQKAAPVQNSVLEDCNPDSHLKTQNRETEKAALRNS